MNYYTHPELEGIHGGNAFTLNDVQYPRVWWRTVTEPEIKDLGFIPYEPEPVEPSTNPADYPLLPWQFKVMVDVLGVDTQIRQAINAIQDTWTRAVALRRYLNASQYDYNDPLLQEIRSQIGMTEEQLAEHWMIAKSLSSAGAPIVEPEVTVETQSIQEDIQPMKIEKREGFGFKE